MQTNLFKEIGITDREMHEVIPDLKRLLERTTPESKFYSKDIIRYFAGKGYSLSQLRLCKLIAFLRVTNAFAPKVIIGCNYGYYLSDNPEFIQQQIESFLGRMQAMKMVADSLVAQKLNLEKMISR
jgi:hypothetical protein